MRTLICVMAFVAGCASANVEARLPVIEQQVFGRLCTLESAEVVESSGIALSRLTRGVYWTHNDSGDGANLYAFDASGKDLGTYTLKGVEAVDWEDIASATINGKPYLFVGDIGDNNRIRQSVIVYRIPEPSTAAGSIQVTEFEKFVLRYPDGEHDCEALLVTPEGNVQLVTKSRDGESGVYFSDLKHGESTLRRLGTLRLDGSTPLMRMATAGDMNANGTRVVIRTYLAALLYEGSPDDWFTKRPAAIPVPFEGQSEAICFDFDFRRVITTSEGSPCQVNWTLIPERK